MAKEQITLRDWQVRRSGASMTVSGIDVATGQPAKVTGITAVGFSILTGQIIAADQQGVCEPLAVLQVGGKWQYKTPTGWKTTTKENAQALHQAHGSEIRPAD